MMILLRLSRAFCACLAPLKVKACPARLNTDRVSADLGQVRQRASTLTEDSII